MKEWASVVWCWYAQVHGWGGGGALQLASTLLSSISVCCPLLHDHWLARAGGGQC